MEGSKQTHRGSKTPLTPLSAEPRLRLVQGLGDPKLADLPLLDQVQQHKPEDENSRSAGGPGGIVGESH